MNIETWVAITTGEIALITAAVAGIKWLVKKYLSELRPNGGSSIHDKINKEIVPILKELRKDQISIKEELSKLEGRFEQHVDENDD